MKTILVPLDGSELSEAGVRLAKLAAGAWNADIELMHVVRDGSRRDLRPRPVSHDGSDAERYLRGVADRHFDNEHVGHVTTSVLSGDPVEQILARAEAQPDQLLAMSTRGRSGFERFAFGSVADKLLRSAPVPLIIVRGDAAVAGELRTILVPLDGSALSEATLPIVTELARRTGATIALLRAVEPYWETQLSWFGINHDDSTSTIEQTAARADQLLTDARAYLERIARGLRLIDVRATWEVRIGKAAAEITRAAETVSPDLVAMATHGRGGFHRWVVGSVTNEVLHRSNVPLLVVPAHLNRARERLEDVDRAPGRGVEGSSMRRAGAGGLSPPS